MPGDAYAIKAVYPMTLRVNPKSVSIGEGFLEVPQREILAMRVLVLRVVLYAPCELAKFPCYREGLLATIKERCQD